jgi:hypothetical protein
MRKRELGRPPEAGRNTHRDRLCVFRGDPLGLNTRRLSEGPSRRGGRSCADGGRAFATPALRRLPADRGCRSPLPLETPWRLRRRGGASFRTPPPRPPPARCSPRPAKRVQALSSTSPSMSGDFDIAGCQSERSRCVSCLNHPSPISFHGRRLAIGGLP